MSIQKPCFRQLGARVIIVAAFMPNGAAEGQTPPPPIVQPGAPGEPSRRLSAEEA